MGDFFNLSTDNTLGGLTPSHFTTPSQKAVKEYIDRYDDELRAFAAEPHRVILSSTNLSSYTSASNMYDVTRDLFPGGTNPDEFNERGDIILIYTVAPTAAIYLNCDNLKNYFPTSGGNTGYYCRKITIYIGNTSTNQRNVSCHLPGMSGTTVCTALTKQTTSNPTGSFTEFSFIGHRSPNFCMSILGGGSYSSIIKYTTWT